MAILETEVWAGLSPTNIKYYENLGHEIPRIKNKVGKIVVAQGTKILVPIEHITTQSNILVTKVCDICNKKIKNQGYNWIMKYRISGDGKDRCYECGVLKQIETKLNNVKYENSLEYVVNKMKLGHLLIEFSEKNIRTPKFISYGSEYKYWWNCPTCNSEYDMNPYDRVNGSNCPFCCGSRVNHTNCLSNIHPEVAKEWHPMLNKNISTFDITAGCDDKFWWLCSTCNESYCSVVKNRTNGSGCPKCYETKSNSKAVKKIKKYFDLNNIEYITEIRFDDCRNINPLPFDFGIFKNNSLSFLLEYDGQQHFAPVTFGGISTEQAKVNLERTIKNDKIKNKYCEDNNIKLYRISYESESHIEDIIKKLLEFHLI